MKLVLKKIFNFLTNNVILNNVLIWFKLDKLWQTKRNPYSTFKPNQKSTIQQNAGYSERTEINEVIEKSKKDLLKCVNLNVKQNAKILDIGCGPGMYLNLFKDKNYQLYATDINDGMLTEVKKNVPNATLYLGNFNDVKINETFDFIYCIGVLIYIGRNDIELFIKKIHSLLNNGGTLYLNYPHALSLSDTFYKNLSYIQYSPQVIEGLTTPYFTIIEHHHAFDDRIIKKYDNKPYKSLNPNTDRTYKNSYLLIAKKK